MNQLLLDLPVPCKRDIFLARQRGRQIASLLNFEPERQAGIAAVVFEMAARACGKRGASLRFQVSDRGLQVTSMPRSPLRLDVPLPASAARTDRADLAWAVQELHRSTPLDIVAEARHQNHELLRVLQELQSARLELVALRPPALRGAA